MKNNISDVEIILCDVYQSLEIPDFSFVQKTLNLDPYRELIESLSLTFMVVDNTDTNDDVCFSLELEGKNHKWLLQLSMVGRYAVCLRLSDLSSKNRIISSIADDLNSNEIELVKMLYFHKFRLMTRSELENPIKLNLLNTEPEDVCVYQALFSDTDFYPWD